MLYRLTLILLSAVLVATVACTKEQLRPSVAEEIVGEYYLAERVWDGVRTTYPASAAPIDIRFDEEGGYRYIETRRASAPAPGGQIISSDTVRGTWFMTDISRLGVDTFEFVFTNQLSGVFAGSSARLEASKRLIVSESERGGIVRTFLRK